nr:unnamed protein product [Callosobruchus analis]
MAGKHVAITKTESYYYNYKKNFSIVLLAVVNSNYEFYDSYRYNGTISDGGVLSSTSCGKVLSDKKLKIPESSTLPNSNKKVPFVFVADDYFALTEDETLQSNRINCRTAYFQL